MLLVYVGAASNVSLARGIVRFTLDDGERGSLN